MLSCSLLTQSMGSGDRSCLQLRTCRPTMFISSGPSLAV